MAIGASAGSEAQAGSRATLASGVAILTLPLVLGRLADFTGLKAAFAVVAVLLVTLLFMMLIGRRFTPESQIGHQLQKTSPGSITPPSPARKQSRMKEMAVQLCLQARSSRALFEREN
jgi:hypothetical protein